MNDLLMNTQNIIDAVKKDGDDALRNFAQQFDKVNLIQLAVSADEFSEAENLVSDEAKVAIQFAQQQLQTLSQAQLADIQTHKRITTSKGVICERQSRPIERIGLYIPGGTAPLISTVLMLGVPSKMANNPLRILCTPPNREGKINAHILYAAKLCGIEKVFKVGGAQAIAAMAYGTESIPKIDKIFGPGNAWVTQAKQLVSQDPKGAVIDMPAGPSEILVIADDKANPDYVAADLLSQAEHGIDSQVILISLSEKFLSEVKNCIELQLKTLSRRNIIEQSLSHAKMIVAKNTEEAVALSNQFAPEHLILQLENPEKCIGKIINAGAVFVGPWAPETVGDYVTGSNHVLPTYGYAKTYSGLSVMDFMKFISIQTVSKAGLQKIGPYAEILATLEGLDAHKNAVSLRLAEINQNG